MTQQRRFGFRPEKTIRSKVRGYDVGNLASAKLILEDPEKYGGEAAGLVIWARMVIKRIEGEPVIR